MSCRSPSPAASTMNCLFAAVGSSQVTVTPVPFLAMPVMVGLSVAVWTKGAGVFDGRGDGGFDPELRRARAIARTTSTRAEPTMARRMWERLAGSSSDRGAWLSSRSEDREFGVVIGDVARRS